jgi:uncharacterized OsmC-like protein
MSTSEVTIQFDHTSRKIEIHLEPFTIIADGGDHTNPSPGTLFLCGLVACTASTARGYCYRNGLPDPEGLKATACVDEQTNLITCIEIQLLLSADFPQDRVEALEKAAGKCTVKKWWQNPPEFVLRTGLIESQAV